ncbi:MAG: peptidoglycan DD-metalloendopeptidase family protein [Candidatus Blackburnbacteria bacterium]|nr:peptidoglycan DD-metalloendopeptidase family protein [Candidatus Blackburnbacteria bacterium]
MSSKTCRLLLKRFLTCFLSFLILLPSAQPVFAFEPRDPPLLPLPFEASISYQITSSFGEKRADLDVSDKLYEMEKNGHNGIDFFVPDKTPVLAVDDGEVVKAGEGDFGNTLVIKHLWGESVYGHLSDTNIKESLKPGNKVAKGQTIALSGSTGISTGPHLHFGIKPQNPDNDNGHFGFIDPAPYLASLHHTGENQNMISEATSSASLNQQPWEASASAGLNKFLGLNNDVLGESTSSAKVSANFEDISKDNEFLFNHKIELGNGTTAHFLDKRTNRASFAIADKDYNYKLRFFLKGSEGAKPQINGNKIEFPVTLYGIPMTLKYTVEENRVKEEFIIQEKPYEEVLDKLSENKLEIPFEISTQDLEMETTGQEYTFKSKDGSVYWSLPAPTLEDSKGNKGTISLDIAPSSASLNVDSDFLKSASYPVTIDPTVVTPSTRTTATAAMNQRKIVRTSEGTVHAFIQTGSTVTMTCAQPSPSGAKAGLLWVTSTDNGSTWTCQGQLNANIGFHASAVADSSDNIYAVYSIITTGGSTSNDIFYRKLTKGAGSTWTLENAVTEFDSTASTTGYSYVTIEIEGTTRLWMAARYYDGTNYQVSTYVSNNLTATATFSTSIATMDTADTVNTDHIPTIIRFGTNFGVLYARSNSLYWRTRADADNPDTWSGAEATVLAGTTGTVGSIFSVTVDNSNNIHAIAMLNGQNSSPGPLNYSYYNGTSWSSAVTLASSNFQASGTATMQITTDGLSVWVFWVDRTGWSGATSVGSIAYKKGVSPFASGNFDANATALNPYDKIFDKVWSYVGGAYTDDTTDAGDSDTGDTQMFTNSGDILYFGMSQPFRGVSAYTSVAGSTGGTVTYEYWDGSNWTALSLTGTMTPNYTSTCTISSTGACGVWFNPVLPDGTNNNWQTTTVNSEQTAYYYVRARVTANYSPTSPVGSQFSSMLREHHIVTPKGTASIPKIYVFWTDFLNNSFSGNANLQFNSINLNQSPSDPTSLGSTALVNGSAGTDNTPSLTFSLSDSNTLDTVQYKIQIDDTSNFSSPVVDYTSALAAQGAASFTVGQAAGSGTYTTGSEGQTLSDGSYYWRVMATDINSATSSYSTANSGAIAFKVDVTAPTGPTNLASSSHTASTWSSDNTVDVTWTAATDPSSGLSGYSYTFDTTSDTTPDTTQDIAGVTTVTSGSLSDGNSHYFHIRAIDSAGNAGSAVHLGPFYIDTGGPTVSGTPASNPTSPSQTTKPAWSWTAAVDTLSGLAATPYTLFWCTSENYGVDCPTFTTTALTNAYTHTVNLADNLWYFLVRAADSVSNTSNYTTAQYRVDTTAPGNPGTPAASSAYINDTTPDITYSAATDPSPASGIASYTVNWSQDSNFGTITGTGSSGTTTFTVPGGSELAQGVWYFQVRAVDSVSLTSSYVNSSAVTIETVAPVDPGTPSSAENPSPDNTPTWSWTASTDAGVGLASTSTYDVQWCTSTGSFGSGGCSSYTSTVDNTATGTISYTNTSSLADGTWYFRVRGRDLAGNTSSWATSSSTTIDTTLPTTPGTPSVATTPTTDTTPSWSWSASTPSGPATITSYTVHWCTSTSNWDTTCSGNTANPSPATSTSYTNAALSDGTWYFRVKSTDSLGKISNWSSNGSVVIDATAPSAPSSLQVTTEASDTTPTITWTGSTDSGVGMHASAPYTFYWASNSGFTGASSVTTTDTSYSIPTALTENTTWYFKATAKDILLNVSSDSNTASILIGANNAAPTGSISINSGSSYTNSRSATLTISAADDADPASLIQMKVSENSSLSGASYETYATSKSFTLSSTDGTKTVYIRFKDSSDNESTIYSDTIVYDGTTPNSVSLESPEDNFYTNQTRPTFRFKAASTPDATSGISSYTLEVTNANSTSFSLGDIPPSRTSDYSAEKYTASYENFSDSDSSNNYITITLKDTSAWSSGENYGKIAEGKNTWKITAKDNASNSNTASRTLYGDFTNPTLPVLSLENLGDYDNYLLLTDLKPKMHGEAKDNLFPHSIELSFYKRVSILGLKITELLTNQQTVTLGNNDQSSTFPFKITANNEAGYGKYQLKVKILDKAGNSSEEKIFIVQILSQEKAEEFLRRRDEEKAEKLKEKSKISLPALEKQAKVRVEKQAQEFAELRRVLRQNARSFSDAFLQMILPVQNKLASLSVSGLSLPKLSLPSVNIPLAYFPPISLPKVPEIEIPQISMPTIPTINVTPFLSKTTQTATITITQQTQELANFTQLANSYQKRLMANLANKPRQNTKLASLELTRQVEGSYEAIRVQTEKAAVFMAEKGSQAFQQVFDTATRANLRANVIISSLPDKLEGPILTSQKALDTASEKSLQAIQQSSDKTLNLAEESTQEVFVAMTQTNKKIRELASSSSTLAQDVNSLLDQTATNYEANTRGTIRQSQDQINKNAAQIATQASQVLKDQANRLGGTYLTAAGYLDRTRIWLLSFNSIVIDPNPTQIADVTIEEIGTDYMVVSWNTNHFSTGKVNYGEDLAYGKEVFLNSLGKHHVAKLTGLKSGTRYYFEVMSQGKTYTYDAFYSFETKSP